MGGSELPSVLKLNVTENILQTEKIYYHPRRVPICNGV